MRRVLVVAAFVALVAVGLSPQSALAAKPDSCPANKPLVVDVSDTARNVADYGADGHVWALDDFTETIQIWRVGANAFCMQRHDVGSFTSFAGPSPEGTGVVRAGVTGFWSFQSGFPLNFGTTDYFLTGANPVLPIEDRTLQTWFNTSAFVTGSAAQPVNHLRTNPMRFATLRGPRTNNVDLALIKDTAIREGMKLRFSAQALNAFNHPLFPAPNLNPANALFGTITASTQANYPRSIQLELKLMF